MPVGIYISVPFCRTKCSYCNFASDVFGPGRTEEYVRRVCEDIRQSRQTVEGLGGAWESAADSVYLGGGTPSILAPQQLERLFGSVRETFVVAPDAEVTVECAPGTLSDDILGALLRSGVNRVSLGVQSFVDQEARAVGRLHTREIALKDMERLRAAGIENLNLDLIAGLPYQTAESWQASLEQVVGSGVPHVSVYMLEVDEDSRLGRELVAGGQRYHAHHVPDEDLVADLYEQACRRLEGAGMRQYEISNFARPGGESRHNLKYWTRQPYLGFGVDAHSMAPVAAGRAEAVRWATPEGLEDFLAQPQQAESNTVDESKALEEAFFLGLRLNEGVDLRHVEQQFGKAPVARYEGEVEEMVAEGLLDREGSRLRLTPRGRVLSNSVFVRFLTEPVKEG